MRILAHATFLTLITSFYFSETRSPTPPFLVNLSLGRFQNHPLNFSWHLPPPEPMVTSTSESSAGIFWNMTPKSNLLIDYNEKEIPEQTSVAPLSSLPWIHSSLSIVADQPSLPTPSMTCLLFASEPILDFYWNATPKYYFVMKRLDTGATTDIFNATLTVIQLGTSSLGVSNQSQVLLLAFNSSLGWSQGNARTSTWHLHMPKPILIAIKDSITAFFWDVTHEIVLFIQKSMLFLLRLGMLPCHPFHYRT